MLAILIAKCRAMRSVVSYVTDLRAATGYHKKVSVFCFKTFQQSRTQLEDQYRAFKNKLTPRLSCFLLALCNILLMVIASKKVHTEVPL